MLGHIFILRDSTSVVEYHGPVQVAAVQQKSCQERQHKPLELALVRWLLTRLHGCCVFGSRRIQKLIVKLPLPLALCGARRAHRSHTLDDTLGCSKKSRVR